MQVTDQGLSIVQYEFFVDVIQEDGYFDLGCTGFVLANVGDGNILINNKLTVLPRQSMALGTESPAHVISQRISIKFAAGASVQRLEIIQQLPKDEKVAHYIRANKSRN